VGAVATSVSREGRVDMADSVETPVVAYQHIKGFLLQLAESLGKPSEHLRIYDPYFAEGGTVRRMAEVGFWRVINRREDFYEAVRVGAVPDHDVVVTNPPYSGDHVEKFLTWAVANGKPWFLLVPNFFYMKDYYSKCIAGSSMLYVAPAKRYTYIASKGVAAASGQLRNKKTAATSPFPSFWYVGSSAAQREAWLTWLGTAPSELTQGWALCRSLEDLPQDVRDAAHRKLAPAPAATSKKKAGLCSTCGQVVGRCKHTR